MSSSAEHIIKRHLTKTARKNWQSILDDIKAVCDGIKPSLLYDYSRMDPIELSKMVIELSSSCRSDTFKKQLKVLRLGEDTFLANIPHLQAVLQETHQFLGEDGRHVGVDVSADLERPRLLHPEACRQLQDHVADVLSQLSGSDSKMERVLGLDPNKDWNFSTMFGALIGYPVLYWYKECTGIDSNCLSFVPLCVYTVQITPDQKTSTEKSNFSSTQGDEARAIRGTQVSRNQHSVYSFSVPQELVHHFEGGIDNWFKRLQETHSNLELTHSLVTLPAVAL
ncbi:UPF0739 protein C1orf74 homolog [Asterias rubens]|uniref:UPF0739 protein C1orf74 homolog n=1 Tax=Asterias rubens TaxID=7604 RepID=UPI0014559F12|nr:UPF0739 protein C1orf74 homolog [Asterias rubens]